MQPDHELLSPEPAGTAGAGDAAVGTPEGLPKGSPVTRSPASMKLAEAEMGVGLVEHRHHPAASMHHRPHMHMHMGPVKAS